MTVLVRPTSVDDSRVGEPPWVSWQTGRALLGFVAGWESSPGFRGRVGELPWVLWMS